jgi:hypothetical protein
MFRSSQFNQQQPTVRAALNGAVMDRGDILSAEIDATPNNTTDLPEMKAAFMHNIRIVGLSNKDVPFNGDDPVAVVSGLLTTTNTGDDIIEAGQIVVAKLPDPSKRQKVAYGGYGGDRKVLQTAPLSKVTFQVDIASLIAPISIALNALVVQAIKNNAKSPALLAKTVQISSLVKELLSSISEAELQSAQTKAMGDDDMKKAMDEVSNVFRLALNQELQTMVGIAVSSASAGNQFDIMVQPPMTL